jgi:hypothetical protein|tara:strand:- start:46 stop:453 length:408 start_codon:yes stop_codon:yes gene_type:complete
MDFSIRKLKTSDYDDLLVGWWEDWGFTPPNREVLPDNAKSGLIVFDKTKPICAGFIYLTNSKVALIEWVISDKKYNDKRKKVRALNLLIDALILTCSTLKIKYIKADNESKSLTKAFIKKGFEKGDVVTHLIKKI